MHCIIEWMEYLFPPLSYLTHHSALSRLLNLSETLYLPGSHIHMSPRYTYRPIQHSPPLFSLYVTRTPLISTIIPHSIIGASTPPPEVWLSLTSHQEHTYCLLPSIHLSRYLPGYLLSRTHLVTRSPTHVVPSRSPGDLSMPNIHSLLPMSAFSLYVSLDLSPLFVKPLLATC